MKISKYREWRYVLSISIICTGCLLLLLLLTPLKQISVDAIRKSFQGEKMEKQKSEDPDKLAKHGYSEDISIEKEVAEFNESISNPELLPVTVGEVMAAAFIGRLRGGDVYDIDSTKVTSETRLSELEKIWRYKKMPKGGRLVKLGPSSIPISEKEELVVDESAQVNCWFIYLYLGLDKKPALSPEGLDPDQVYLVRQQCSGIEIKKH